MARTLGPVPPVRGWLLAPVVAAALFLVPMPAWAVDEFYSRDLYPWLQRWITALTNLAPFAVIDLLIVVLLALVILRAIRLVPVIRQAGFLAAFGDAGRRIVRAVAVVAIAFVGLWGCNYRRLPLERALPGGVAAQVTLDDLEKTVLEANALAGQLRPALVAEGALSYEAAAASLVEPMHAALADLNRTPLKRPGRPKTSLLLTPFFTWAGVNGMIDPIALESIVHPDLLPFERAFVLSHEWAHLAGQADEAEASAVGWLACMKGTPQTAYSASLYLVMEGMSELPGDARRRLWPQIDAGVRRDYDAIVQRMVQQQKPQVQATATRVYDSYLRANRVADGTRSYSRALTLIMAAPLRSAIGGFATRKRF